MFDKKNKETPIIYIISDSLIFVNLNNHGGECK